MLEVLDSNNAVPVGRHREHVDQSGKNHMARIGAQEALAVEPLINENVFPENSRTEVKR